MDYDKIADDILTVTPTLQVTRDGENIIIHTQPETIITAADVRPLLLALQRAVRERSTSVFLTDQFTRVMSGPIAEEILGEAGKVLDQQ